MRCKSHQSAVAPYTTIHQSTAYHPRAPLLLSVLEHSLWPICRDSQIAIQAAERITIVSRIFKEPARCIEIHGLERTHIGLAQAEAMAHYSIQIIGFNNAISNQIHYLTDYARLQPVHYKPLIFFFEQHWHLPSGSHEGATPF